MRDGVRISLIAAVADNGVIGDGPTMPWRLSTDMRRFRQLTLGKPVVMGRKTFESLPGPLGGRMNVVVSRQEAFQPDGTVAYPSVEQALDAAAEAAGEEVMVIGGGGIYAATIDRADRLYITHVALRPDGNVFFPDIDPGQWRPATVEQIPSGARDSASSRFVVYDRVRPVTG